MEIKLKCGCEIFNTKRGLDIIYCPLHKSAPDLYEACKEALGWLIAEYPYDYSETKNKLSTALTKADGK